MALAINMAAMNSLSKARNRMLLASLVALISSAVGFAALDSDGGIIWTGGFLVAGFMYWSSFKAFRLSHELGARLSSGGVVLAAVVLLLGLGPAAAFGLAYLVAESTTTGSNSTADDCWTEPNAEGLVESVPCDDERAAYIVSTTVTTKNGCPASASGSVIGDSPDEYFCLVPHTP